MQLLFLFNRCVSRYNHEKLLLKSAKTLYNCKDPSLLLVKFNYPKTSKITFGDILLLLYNYPKTSKITFGDNYEITR